jgi:rhodanese-related sulfurtransferase
MALRKGFRQMVDEAKSRIKTLSLDEARAKHGRLDVLFVDLRDVRELEREGQIPGAFHCPRGMLEFWIDPASPYFKPVFGADKKYVFFCAGGLRSALAAKTAQDMGLKPVAHIVGGFGAWKAAGGPVEAPPPAAGDGGAKA